MADGVMDYFYNKDKNETYEIVDAQARSAITVLDSELGTKVDKVTGKGLSTNDYTDAEQGKLGRIEDGAELNNVFVYKATSVMLDPDNSTIICYILQGSLPRDNNYGLNDRDMVIVDFNGVDATQLPLTSLNIVKFYILGTPTSEVSIYHEVKFRADDGILYSSGMLNYWKPNSIRTFLYKYPVGGTYQGLLLQMPTADLTHYGEVRLSNSLSDAIETTAATSYAVKRLKDLIDSISGGGLSYEVVQSLPVVDISTSTIYLVPKQTAGTQNVYDEYINPTGTTAGWEKIGDTEIDLTNYYTKTETDTLLDDKADTADLAAVATTGSYNDLVDKPSIPSGQVQSDWNQTNSSEVDYIKNKPTIPAAQVNADWNASSGVAQILNKPTIPDISTKMDKANPTGTGRLLIENDSAASYMRTSVSSTGGQAQIETDTGGNSGMVCKDAGGTWHTAVKLNASTGAWYGDLVTEINGKKAKLVSGTNIKTINGRTILGSGDFSIPEPDNYSTITSGEASAASGSWTSAYSFTFGSTGLWIVQISLTWSTNSTGYREAGLNTSVAQPTAMNVMRMSPATNVQTTANLTLLVNVTSATQTYYIVQRHNAGQSLTVYPRMSVVRLSY